MNDLEKQVEADKRQRVAETLKEVKATLEKYRTDVNVRAHFEGGLLKTEIVFVAR